MAKGIPYGISDFSRLIDQNYYYVDKTHFIPQIEEIANYLFPYSSPTVRQECISHHDACLLRYFTERSF